MAKRRKKAGRKKARRKGGRRKKASHRSGKGKIPLKILERRLGKLARIVKSRGGRLPH